MNDPRHVALRRLALAMDALALPVSAAAAFALHQALRPFAPWLKEPAKVHEFAALLYFLVPMWLGLVVVLRLHRVFERRWSTFSLLVDLLKLHGLGLMGLTGILYFTQGVLNRGLVVLFLAVNLVVSFAQRRLLASYVEGRYRRGESQESWLIVGEPTDAVRNFVAQSRGDEFAPKIVGILCEPQTGLEEVPPIGQPAQLRKVLHEGQVDLVVFFPPYNRPEDAEPLLHECERVGTRAAFAVGAVHRYPIVPQVVQMGNTPFLTFDWVPPRPGALSIKHGLDFLAATLGLVLISPILLFVAVGIWLTMGRPILFAQQRVGLNGRRFKLYKFRTMVNDAEARKKDLQAQNEMSGPVFKLTRDPRVTPFGQWLRKWSLDELPQLFNVVLGSMSLVGPRPLPVAEQQDIEGWYRRRLTMKPGITGVWQVSGRNDVDFNEWMKMDLKYIENWSLRRDAQLLLETVPAVLLRRGAR